MKTFSAVLGFVLIWLLIYSLIYGVSVGDIHYSLHCDAQDGLVLSQEEVIGR